MSTDRSINAKVYASCRFDRKGHPPPDCEFTVCSVIGDSRQHIVFRSCSYPKERNVVMRGKVICDGFSCKRFIAIVHKPDIEVIAINPARTNVKQLESETQQ